MLTASLSREFPPDDARDWSLWSDQPPRHTAEPLRQIRRCVIAVPIDARLRL